MASFSVSMIRLSPKLVYSLASIRPFGFRYGRMRIHEIHTRLHLFGSSLQLKSENAVAADGRPGYRFSKLNQYRQDLRALAPIPALGPYIEPILSLEAFTDVRDELVLPQGHIADRFVRATRDLALAAALLREMLDRTLSPEDDLTLAVELPDTDDLEEMVEVIGELQKFLSGFVGISLEEDERVAPFTLASFDIGSKWLVVRACSKSALNLIGWVIRGAVYLLDWGRRKAAEAKLLSDLAEDTKSAVELNKKLRIRLAREIAGNIAKNAAPSATEEQINRIAALLTHGERLIERRVKLLPSLKAPEEAKNAFPPARTEASASPELLPGVLERLLPRGDDAPDD